MPDPASHPDPSSRRHLDLTILSQPRYLCVVRAAVEAAARQMGLTREQADAVVIAVDEAVSNVIRHGYAMADDQPIRVLMGPGRCNGSAGVQVEIEDACRRLRPRDIRARLHQADAAEASITERRQAAAPGGLGLHLIRQAMDHVEVSRREDDGGIRLTLFKAAGPQPTLPTDPHHATRDSEGAEP